MSLYTRFAFVKKCNVTILERVKLPNSNKAVIQIEKLTDYCLNTHHPVGKHKAIVFNSKLGITFENADELKNKLLEAVKSNEAFESFSDKYGKRYYVDFNIDRQNKYAVIRSIWIVRINEDFPRFITCYVKN